MSGERAGGHTLLGYGPFVPEDYLSEYYSTTLFENDEIMCFFAEAARRIGPRRSMLEYGGGPTIYQLVSLAPLVDVLRFTDYLEVNLDAVARWVDGQPDAHDWRDFISVALRHEGRVDHADPSAIEARAAQIRSKLTDFGHVDLFQPELDAVAGQQFDIVGANFVAESVAVSEEEWTTALATIANYVSEGGHLIVSAILDAEYWVTGDFCFDCLPVSSTTVRESIESLGFEVLIQRDASVRQPDPTAPDYEGYDGMTFVLAQRTAARLSPPV